MKFNALLTNVVIFHNTLDIAEIVRQLLEEGWEIDPEDLAHISPYLTERIRRFGEYSTYELGLVPEAYDPHLDVDFSLLRADAPPAPDGYGQAAWPWTRITSPCRAQSAWRDTAGRTPGRGLGDGPAHREAAALEQAVTAGRGFRPAMVLHDRSGRRRRSRSPHCDARAPIRSARADLGACRWRTGPCWPPRTGEPTSPCVNSPHCSGCRSPQPTGSPTTSGPHSRSSSASGSRRTPCWPWTAPWYPPATTRRPSSRRHLMSLVGQGDAQAARSTGGAKARSGSNSARCRRQW